MLVLSRRKDESVMIGDNLQVKILDIQKNQVKLGIEAPRDVTVHRMEVYETIQRENLAATAAAEADVDQVSALAGLFKSGGVTPAGEDKGSKAEAKPKARIKSKGKKKPQ